MTSINNWEQRLCKISNSYRDSRIYCLSSEAHWKNKTWIYGSLLARFRPWENESQSFIRLNRFMRSKACQNNGCFPAFWNCMLRDRGITFRTYLPTPSARVGGGERDVWLKNQIYRHPCSLHVIFEYSPTPQGLIPSVTNNICYFRTLQSFTSRPRESCQIEMKSFLAKKVLLKCLPSHT